MNSPIEDVPLNPGDMVDVWYELKTTNQTLVGEAIKAAKQGLVNDPRVHYLGFRMETDYDPILGEPVQCVVFIVQAADPSKVTGNNPAEPETVVLQAGILSVTVIIGIIAVVLASLGTLCIVYKTSVVNAIQANPNTSDATKQASLNALPGSGLGKGLAALGGGLTTVAIILAVLWGLSLLHRSHS
jgi:hypothetical protein